MTVRLRTKAVFFFLVLFIGLGIGHFNYSRSHKSSSVGALRVPNKDELYWVGSTPFTLSGFHSLQSKVKTKDTQSLVWIGVASLALREASPTSTPLTLDDALSLARFAQGDLSELKMSPSIQKWWGSTQGTPTRANIQSRIEADLARVPTTKNPGLLLRLIDSRS
jgi:hypothetical protein